MLPFKRVAADGNARAGVLQTAHGAVETPAFMPVGTSGTVKGIAAWELENLAPQMVLANTYHLCVRPGVEGVEALGGLHRLMAWDGPILTDSGGFQVFSLSRRCRLDENGVSFQSHLDGSALRLEPESAVAIQARFGVDVAMQLDECLPYPCASDRARESVARSARWAIRGLEEAGRRRDLGWRGGLFAIQQGSIDSGLRLASTEALAAHPFDGFAIGGLAVGEPPEVLHDAVARFAPMLPEDRPRYLMGVGYPGDLIRAIAAGVDLFDCVLPTRSARTGKVFTSRGPINIKNAVHAASQEPLDPSCTCPTCARYSRGVLRHYYQNREATSVVLLTVHNLSFFLSLMRRAREAIIGRSFASLADELLAAGF